MLEIRAEGATQVLSPSPYAEGAETTVLHRVTQPMKLAQGYTHSGPHVLPSELPVRMHSPLTNVVQGPAQGRPP